MNRDLHRSYLYSAFEMVALSTREVRERRALYPLRGRAAGGPESDIHDATFTALGTWQEMGWSVFGEVPTRVGTVDLIALRFSGVVDLSVLTSMAYSQLASLSSIRRGVGYRRQTLTAALGEEVTAELLSRGVLISRGALITRDAIPSDFVRRSEVFEIKASNYAEGVAQAAVRAQYSTRSWLVLPSGTTLQRLGARTLALIEKLGVGVRTPSLDTLLPAKGRQRPPAVNLNWVLKGVASKGINTVQ